MWETLIEKIRTTFTAVDKVQLVLPHPIDNLDQLERFPAVVFFPDTDNNTFETNAENMKQYRFRAFVFIQLNEQTNAQKIYTDAMPKVIDAIYAQFDQDWDMGTVDGHRVWVLLEGGRWDTDASSAKGKIVYAELNIRIKALTTN